MPPKIKITEKNIVDTTLELVRREGESAINARRIAARLGSSTQPIFSNFETMEELRRAVSEAAFGLYLEFLTREAESGKYPEYKSRGMAYIRFAKEERELFKLLFMCDRGGSDDTSSEDFQRSVEIVMRANGISRERAELMHLEMWATVHGIAVMLATSFFTPSLELISDMLTDVYMGTRQRHISEEKRLNECH